PHAQDGQPAGGGGFRLFQLPLAGNPPREGEVTADARRPRVGGAEPDGGVQLPAVARAGCDKELDRDGGPGAVPPPAALWQTRRRDAADACPWAWHQLERLPRAFQTGGVRPKEDHPAPVDRSGDRALATQA